MDNILKELKTHLISTNASAGTSGAMPPSPSPSMPPSAGQGGSNNRSRRPGPRSNANQPSRHVSDSPAARAGRRAPKYKDHRDDLPRRRPLAPISDRPTRHDDVETDSTMKVIALGGLGEVGRNMAVVEYKNDIVLIDIGFGFPEEDQPGVDYVLPNIAYLDGKQDRIRGLLITHGHMDHVGGLPYLINRLGNPTIYTANLTRGIIIKRQEEFPNGPQLDIEIIKAGDTVKLGEFEVEFFHVNHNIPDATALVVSCPAGRIVHTCDFKLDPTPLNEAPADLDYIKTIGDRGVSLLMSDSTGAEKEGSTISESTVQDNLEEIFKEAKGRIITATFSSLLNRIQQLITLSERYNRKVVFDGFSLKSNVEYAKESGQLHIGQRTQISIDQVDDYPDANVTIIGTGGQGEERAVLMRIASGEHRWIRLKKSDSVIFSSSVIPGNERTVQRLKDLLYRLGAHVYHSGLMDIHASGHAHQEDLKKMMQLIRPKFLMPVHGYYSMMVSHGYLGQKEGISEKNTIIADNGSIIHILDPENGTGRPRAEIEQRIEPSPKGDRVQHSGNLGIGRPSPDVAVAPAAPSQGDAKRSAENNFGTGTWWFDKKTAQSEIIMVDGLGIGDIGNVVLRDRQVLAEDGMFVIVTVVGGKDGKVRSSPDIISRGFVYLKENKDLLMQVRKRVRFIIEKKATRPINWAYLRDAIRDEIGLFLFQKTERRPMVLPVIIEV